MNIYNQPLAPCGPDTGYHRTGYCTTDSTDRGVHVVCGVVTNEFLQYTLKQGNDLITPRSNFPGLKPGDKWCLCANRWIQAYHAGVAPLIDLKATSVETLKYINYKTLRKFSV